MHKSRQKEVKLIGRKKVSLGWIKTRVSLSVSVDTHEFYQRVSSKIFNRCEEKKIF